MSWQLRTACWKAWLSGPVTGSGRAITELRPCCSSWASISWAD